MLAAWRFVMARLCVRSTLGRPFRPSADHEGRLADHRAAELHCTRLLSHGQKRPRAKTGSATVVRR